MSSRLDRPRLVRRAGLNRSVQGEGSEMKLTSTALTGPALGSTALAALLLALGACTGPGAEPPAPSGGSAGAEGPAYCETVPTNPDDMEDWNQLCSPDGRR